MGVDFCVVAKVRFDSVVRFGIAYFKRSYLSLQSWSRADSKSNRKRAQLAFDCFWNQLEISSVAKDMSILSRQYQNEPNTKKTNEYTIKTTPLAYIGWIKLLSTVFFTVDGKIYLPSTEK